MGARGVDERTVRATMSVDAPRFVLVEDAASRIGARLGALGWRPQAGSSHLGDLNRPMVSSADVIVVVCTERELLTPGFQTDAERVGRGIPRVAVIAEAGPDAAAYAARLGWHAFVSAESTDAGLVRAIVTAARGELSFPASATSALARALARVAPVNGFSSAALTPRQQQIVALLAQGATDAEIASELRISLSTAHKHVQNARRRMHAKTRSQLVAAARTDSLGAAS